MRFLFVMIYFSLGVACKTQKPQTPTNNSSADVTKVPEGTKTSEIKDSLTVGKVTYLLNKGNCVTVIIQNKETETDKKIIIIPKDPLPPDLDKEGALIKFNYRLLRMKNSEGCLQGIPAALTDVVKK